ncbi:MAG: archaeal preflagellin peptidase FlaK [Thermococcaceae archaeon]|nr:archaeal preflagellin peptidase FlaK [Thermococcaceae archaeon]
MELLPLLLGVVMGVFTSYTDIKTGFIDDIHVFPTLTLIGKLKGKAEEPTGALDKIPVPAVEAGILYYLYLGLREGSLKLALSGVAGLLIGFVLGLLLYYLGGWASGDVVILAAYSALLPYAPKTAKVFPPYTLEYPLYPLTIFLNSLLAVFPFIFLYSLGIIIYRRLFGELKAIFAERALFTLRLSLWIMAAFGIRIILLNFGIKLGSVTGWLLTIVLITVFGKLGRAGDVAGIAVLAYLIYMNPLGTLLLFLRLIAVLYTFKVFFSLVKFMRKEALMEEVPVEDLREWDIMGETIYEYNMWPMRDRSSLWDRIKEAITSGDLSKLKGPKGRIIASPSAEGLTKEQIEELRRYVEMGMLENKFLRKKSMPFAPALFIGFLIAYFWGDLFWWIELKLSGL